MVMRPIDKLLPGRNIRSEHGGRVSATAGGAGDATAAALSWVDRKPSDRGSYHGAKLVLAYRAVLAQGATLSLTALIRDATSAAGANAADIETAVSFGVVATGGTGGSTELGTVEIDVDLSAMREFVGVTVTPDLSAGGTDTCTIDAIWLLMGTDRSVVSKASTAQIRGDAV